MLCHNLYNTVFVLRLCIVLSDKPSSQKQLKRKEHDSFDYKKHKKSQSSDKSRYELVKISLQASHQLEPNIVHTYTLNSLEDVNKFKSKVTELSEDIQLTIIRRSSSSLILNLKQSPLLISKKFFKKYFTPSGVPIIKSADEQDVALAHCFFTGDVQNQVYSMVSLNLCNGVKGTLELSNHTYMITPTIISNKLNHHLYLMNTTNRNDELKECGTEGAHHFSRNKNFNNSTNYAKNQNKRELNQKRPVAGYSSTTKYVEMILVMDNSQFQRAGSIEATVVRAMTLLNHANFLLRQLDIYIAVISLEIWNDRDKIPYPEARDGSEGVNHNQLLSNLRRYRQHKLNWNLPNDNIQLFTTLDFEGSTIGLGSTEGICSQPNNGGITSDTIEDDPIRAATTMAHELGHNLGLKHTSAFTDEACLCEDPVDPEYTHCVMHPSSSCT
ncbi:ADAM28 [Bugula neritina]|uniref:ADAM28 n=1 Tax=Bugula neritina TaxID=10212 RepID=A0A7J7KHM1_BUGNE|nr:ADAM28 [Bugula neritina]